jgi:hypothetical protein
LLFVPKNILVENQMLDEVTLKTRFIGDAPRGPLIGNQAGDAPIVWPNLPDSHVPRAS